MLLTFTFICQRLYDGKTLEKCFLPNFCGFFLDFSQIRDFYTEGKKKNICPLFDDFLIQKKLKIGFKSQNERDSHDFFFRDVKKCLNLPQKKLEVIIFWIHPSRLSDITEGKKKPICPLCPDDIRILAVRVLKGKIASKFPYWWEFSKIS